MYKTLDPSRFVVFITGATSGFGAAAARRYVAAGGKVIAVTAKSERGTILCLGALEMTFDAVVADVHGDGKRDALKEHNATIYVGDTIADIRAGVEAGAQAVGVSTGMHTAQELEAAGATVVLPSLAHFPSWMERR